MRTGTCSRLFSLCLALLSASATAQEEILLPRDDARPVPARVYGVAGEACRGIVIVSHGAGGSEAGMAYLGRALSGAGYLALALGHRESGAQALRDRVGAHGPREGMLRMITDAGAYEGRFRDIEAARRWAASRCGATRSVLLGHSMGAATVMLEAGAANRLGLRGTNAFDAYVALSPQGEGSIFPPDAWRGITRPVLSVTGTRDDALEGDWRTRLQPFDQMSPGCKWQGVIDGATHMHFAGRGDSARTEALTVLLVEAFVRAAAGGDCTPPAAPAGLTIRSR